MKILLIVGGGIAAYKACELIRLCRKGGIAVKCVLTDGGAHFVTPMTLAAGVTVLEPDEGAMACGEYGPGRLPEPSAIFAAIQAALAG